MFSRNKLLLSSINFLFVNVLSGSIFWKTFFKNSKQHFVLCKIEDESCNDLSIPCLTRHLTLSAWPFKKTEHLTTPLTPSKQMKKLIYPEVGSITIEIELTNLKLTEIHLYCEQ